jgi:glycine betaine/proline transport system ATP-binding protein
MSAQPASPVPAADPGALPAVAFEAVDIVFGDDPRRALPLVDRGASRAEILAETGQILGVAGASLEIGRGELCVLMGLSGSGKSTLLRAVNRLNPVTRGRVLVADQGRPIDVGACDPATLRRLRMSRIAMVFQQFALLPWRTVKENVGFGLELRGLPAAEIERTVQEKLELVGLGPWAHKLGHELSGGMQQRVGLARAFATDADILLMDEPFSALDPLIRTKLQDELLELQARLHKTIVFVSHDLDEALKLGTRIAIMQDARIVQVGAPEAIILKPATEYVREFVQNVNPLNVLTAYNVMRDARDLPTAGEGWVWLDRRRTTRLRLDGAGRVDAAERDGRPATWIPFAEHDPPPADAHIVYWGTPATPLRAIMLAMHRDAAPVALFDAEDRLVGAIGVRDVLQAILRRPGLAYD